MLMTFLRNLLLSYLFLNFESSLVFGLPFGIFILISLYFFILSMLKGDFQMLLNQILYHFYGTFFPSAWLMVVLFMTIMLMNVFGLVPGTFSFSSLPLMTLSMGLVMWSSSYIYCLWTNYDSCVSHFLPQGAPMALGVVLVWIEILSWLCRPLALSIRLMANITASHLLMFLCGSGVFFSSYLFLLPGIFLLALVSLEVGVAFIQSYVYQLLLSLYMSESLDSKVS